jgi:hypothetical protein
MKGTNDLDYGTYDTTRTAIYGFGDESGMETVPNWACQPDCLVAALDGQSGDVPGMSSGGAHVQDYPGGLFGSINSTHTARGDAGGASRFFPQFHNFDEATAWCARLIGVGVST